MSSLSFSPDSPPACRVFHDANQSIPDDTETTVEFNSERFDNNTMHDTVTNNSRITFTDAGLYLVGFHGRFETRSTYSTTVPFLRLNGTTYIADGTAERNAIVPSSIGVTTLYQFVAADFVEVRVYQNNTAVAARNLLAAAESSPEFWAVRVG
jgi:hypothetical protein